VYVSASVILMGSGVAFLIVMKRFGSRLTNVLPSRLARAYDRFETGTLGSLRRIPLLVIISISVWFLEAGRLLLVVSALDLSLAFSVILIVTMAHALLASVPTPGGLGAVEVGVAGLLVLAGMAQNDAGAVVIAERSITLLSVIGIGGILFLLRQTMQLQVPNKKGQGAGQFENTVGNEDA
jgi:glycosyltransferase 2 family protein